MDFYIFDLKMKIQIDFYDVPSIIFEKGHYTHVVLQGLTNKINWEKYGN